MNEAPTLEDVSRALALADFDVQRAWRAMSPRPRPFRRPASREGAAREAAVLLLLYPIQGRLHFVLTQRSASLGQHSGQISLPGGAREPGDQTLADTALRETCEEIHTCQDAISVLGHLSSLYVIVSDYQVEPYVGYVPYRPTFVPDPVEVDELIEMPLQALLDDAIKTEEHWQIRGFDLDVPFYRFNGHVIWGATAILLSEFEQRLKAVLAGQAHS